MRILVADDHEVVRSGIRSVLSTDPSLALCGEAVDGRDAVQKAQALRPDIVIMDVSMPNMDGLEATREIKRLLPEIEIVIMSQHDAPEMVRQAFKAGARAYVVKSVISKDLLAAIAKAHRHESFITGVEQAGASQNLDAKEILQRSAALERALRESEERFRTAMNNLAEGLYTIDTEGRVTYVNPAAEAMLGWASDELVGKKIHDITHYKYPDGRPFPSAECPGLQVLQKGAELREHEDAFIRKDGSFFPVVFSASPMKIQGAIVGVVVGFRDDTKRRQAEEALRQSEQLYRGIGESIDYGIWICDSAGRNIYASPSFLRLLDLTQEQCSQMGWTHVLHPDDAANTIAAWKECVRTGAFWEREHRFLAADGQWHYVLARGGPIRDSQGKILYWAGINLDIQRRKEAERELQLLVQTLETRIFERTQELENATDKLRELSSRLLQTQDEERRRIARELHDGVGQLLVALKMNLSVLKNEKSALSHYACQSLEENATIIDQASREIRTMSHLLHPPLLDEVGLESALRWYVDGFAERSKINVQLQLTSGFSEALPRELALTLFRVVQECLTNVHRHAESPTAFVCVNRSAHEISLEVKDEGIGIPPEMQSKIAARGSSGVGIRGMRERIRQFGGRFDVHSGDDGTRISVVLPIHETLVPDLNTDDPQQSPYAVAALAPSDIPLQDSATILCIDDEDSGLIPRKLLLESAGHRVLEARSGLEGIQLFQSQKIDAVILDYWMSGMKGTDVASELKRIKPDVPIIVLSGMADLPGEAAGLVDQWLVKGTLRADGLLDSINTLLDRRSA
jgi:PAS domain S-box-containing protein